jgi:cytoskeletal protein CcmA (bactofilin family)
MALFNREAERGGKPQQRPAMQAQPGQPVQAPPAPPMPESKPSSARTAPVASSEPHAHLDSGSRISGKLHFEGPVRIDGQVEGEITAKQGLIVGESAIVTAQIKGSSIVVAGKVSGDITASQRIEIRPSAKVLGNLASPVLVIQEGALFEGHCAMQPEGAQETRKLTVLPKEERLAQSAGQKAG